jgi:hypothetical protein
VNGNEFERSCQNKKGVLVVTLFFSGQKKNRRLRADLQLSW